MKHFLLKTCLIVVCLIVGVGTGWAEDMTIDFESATSTYSDWTFNNITSEQTTITAHGGSKHGQIAAASGYIVTKNAIANPSSITFYVSKSTNNTTSSNWKVQVSSNNSSWTDVKTQSATSMSKGTWVEVTQSLTAYNDVYVRVYYSGSTAVRCIDDVTLTTSASAVPAVALADVSLDFGNVVQNEEISAKTIAASLSNTSSATVSLSGSGASAFSIDKTTLTESGNITVTPNTSVVGTFEATLTLSADGATPASKTISMTVEAPFNGTITTMSAEESADIKFVTGSSSTTGAFWANSTPLTANNITLSGSVTSGTNYSYYDGSVVRFYANNNIVITPSNGATITKIEIVRQSTAGNNTGTINCSGLTASNDNTTTNTNVYTGSATSTVTFTASAQARFTKILVYTTGGSSKTSPTLSFSPAVYNYTMGEAFTAPTLTNPENVPVTYSASDVTPANCIEVANDGTVTVNAAGSATITASFAGDETYKEASASYELVVASAPVPVTDKTIAEFIAAEGGKCYLTGIVSDIKNTTYGNFTLTDESGSIYVYGCLTTDEQKGQFSTLDVVVGDKIKVLANAYEYFNGTTHEAKDVIFVEEIEIEKTKYTVTIETPENGTLVVKDGETVLASGAQVEEGKTLTIECTPTDAETYRYKNWQYKEDGNWITMDKTMTRVVTKDIAIRANFELIPTYTVAFSVNGVEVQSDNLKEGAAVTAYADPEAIYGKVFTGWIETATVVGATPAYVTPITTATKTVTYYAVFATYDSEATPDQWQTTTLSALTSSDVFVMASGTNAISSANGTSGNPAAIALTVSAGKITSEVTDAIKWTLTGNATDGYTFYKNGSTDYLYVNTTASSSSNTCIRVGTQNSNIRNNWKPDNNGYLKTNDSYTARYLSFYSTGSDFRGYVNTSNGAFAPTFYKLIPGGETYTGYTTTVAVPLPAYGELNFVATTGNDNYYATFSCDRDVIFDAEQMIEVQTIFVLDNEMAITKVSDNSLSAVTDKTKDEGWVAGYYVPANTGVLVYSAGNEPAKYYYTEANVYNILEDVDEDNMLVACPTTGACPTVEGTNFYYKLAYGDNTNKTKLGFWWGANDGSGNFNVKAGGAVLVVPQSQAGSNLRGFSFDYEDTLTGLDALEIANDSVIYNIQGQRITRVQQGVNIVNGKKVIR